MKVITKNAISLMTAVIIAGASGYSPARIMADVQIEPVTVRTFVRAESDVAIKDSGTHFNAVFSDVV